MLSRNERIDRKAKMLQRLDPEREVELEDAFTSHVADAIRASSPTEHQQAIDKATEAYEDALDGVLCEILDKRFAAEGPAVSEHHRSMVEEGEQEAAVGAFLLAHEGHTPEVEVQRGAWTVYCRGRRCEDVHTYGVEWPEDKKRLA